MTDSRITGQSAFPTATTVCVALLARPVLRSSGAAAAEGGCTTSRRAARPPCRRHGAAQTMVAGRKAGYAGISVFVPAAMSKTSPEI